MKKKIEFLTSAELADALQLSSCRDLDEQKGFLIHDFFSLGLRMRKPIHPGEVTDAMFDRIEDDFDRLAIASAIISDENVAENVYDNVTARIDQLIYGLNEPLSGVHRLQFALLHFVRVLSGKRIAKEEAECVIGGGSARDALSLGA